MLEYIVLIIAIAGAALASWYCYRWGRDDGRAEGYDNGRTAGLREGADIVVSPSLASGGPRERA